MKLCIKTIIEVNCNEVTKTGNLPCLSLCYWPIGGLQVLVLDILCRGDHAAPGYVCNQHYT